MGAPTMLRTPRLLLLLAALSLAGCTQSRLEASARLLARHTAVVEPGRERPPRVRRHQVRDPDTGVVVRRWAVLVSSGGREQRHGLDERWWPDGTARARREFRRGRDAGHWVSWYPDGTKRSEYRFEGSDTPSPMEFFHPNGQTSAWGAARDGVREGPWVFYHPGGGKAKEGVYEKGRKSGPWTLYHENGGLKSHGVFSADRRVGEWRHWPAEPPMPVPADGRHLRPLR